jgi:sialate O-acetylesterase
VVKIAGQTKKTKTAKGNWTVALSSMKAGGPFSMTVTCGGETITLSDILVGDVWFAGGQSNMLFNLRGVADAKTEIQSADYPVIRYYKAPRKFYESQNPSPAEWKVCSPSNVGELSAVAYYFAKVIHKELNIPVGIVLCSVGGTGAEAWMSRETLESDGDFVPIVNRYDSIVASYKQGEYETRRKDYQIKLNKYNEEIKTKRVSKPTEPMGEKNFRRPYALYQYMLKPLIPYTIKGIIFYQGETNGSRGYQYRKLFPALIHEWRMAWGQKNIPFLFVQLPKYKGGKLWEELREAQLLTSMKVKNTGMVVAYDQGNPDDIHPVKKDIVGDRLAKLALGKVYHRKIAYSGPLYKSARMSGDTAKISFSYTGSGLATLNGSEQVTGFTVAGDDGVFHEAEACIRGSNVFVSSPKVKKPVAVRYGWAGCMDINLMNKEGFPASPFRTDKFPLATLNVR